MAVLQIGVALALFYGAFTRAAALALVGLWAAGVVYFGPVLLLEQAIVPGIALTLAITGRGPFAVDALLSARRGRPRLRRLHHAITPLRIGTGISLATLAFTEKLWNLPLGLAFLERYPVNFMPSLGIPMDDRTFLLAAGTVELLAGLLLIDQHLRPPRDRGALAALQPDARRLRLARAGRPSADLWRHGGHRHLGERE